MVKTSGSQIGTEPAAYATFAEWLEAQTSVHGTKARLALAIGASGQDINGWINGKRPGPERLRAIARYFDVRYVDLLAFWDPAVREGVATYSAGSSLEPRGVHSVPVRGAISPTDGGFWMHNEIDDTVAGGRVRWLTSAPELYAYQVVGDELSPRIHGGEFVIVDPRETVKPGDEVLLLLTDNRFAILQYVSQAAGVTTFQRVGGERRPFTARDVNVVDMHKIVGRASADYLVTAELPTAVKRLL